MIVLKLFVIKFVMFQQNFYSKKCMKLEFLTKYRIYNVNRGDQKDIIFTLKLFKGKLVYKKLIIKTAIKVI